MPNASSSTTLDRQAEATVRRLRTVLEEARSVIQAAPDDDRVAWLEHAISQLQREAEYLAPDFPSEILRNGESEG